MALDLEYGPPWGRGTPEGPPKPREHKLGPLRIVRGHWIAVYWNAHCVSIAPRRKTFWSGFTLLWKD